MKANTTQTQTAEATLKVKRSKPGGEGGSDQSVEAATNLTDATVTGET